jgi:hypothetical protein
MLTAQKRDASNDDIGEQRAVYLCTTQIHEMQSHYAEKRLY